MLRFILIFLMLSGCQTIQKQEVTEVICTRSDSLLLIQKLDEFSRYSNLSLIDIASSFMNTPYEAKTLEHSPQEQVVVNTSSFDCTTFIETCIALNETYREKEYSFNDYVVNLKTIRYRNGALKDYSSRLHYFTEWILDQKQKGLVQNITRELGGEESDVEINFMSEHISAYKQLLSDSNLVKLIKDIEARISGTYYIIPQAKIEAIDAKLNDGMIVGFTTNIKGLDFVHTGFVIRKGGKAHLLHASSDAGKVVISSKPISEYIRGNEIQTGIVVLKIL